MFNFFKRDNPPDGSIWNDFKFYYLPKTSRPININRNIDIPGFIGIRDLYLVRVVDMDRENRWNWFYNVDNEVNVPGSEVLFILHYCVSIDSTCFWILTDGIRYVRITACTDCLDGSHPEFGVFKNKKHGVCRHVPSKDRVSRLICAALDHELL